ncbi:unnamed protein product [Acanthoscelides obtectus]|uniref:MADF domain-containing protein n=1 Tax=Acanthoscelides obtectus TaxID=200917 RepID=A0A9P0JNT4_ACAOB|nr:unnamed protein product [Acanthoscelides obtectus]CAK1642890.1 hypothetical protein AOBTE_LOCUS13271 [Acanthoscelides obtectus]
MDSWSEEKILCLMNVYKIKTLLWDPKNKNHFKKNFTEDTWREIADEMETTAEQCKEKIISLLASFRREKNKTKQGTGTGKGRDEVYYSRWFAYEAFRFLEDRDLPRKRLATELDDVNEAAVSSEQMEQDAIPETPTLPSTSKSTKRSKRKQDNVFSPIMSDAFQILKNAAKKWTKSQLNPVK